MKNLKTFKLFTESSDNEYKLSDNRDFLLFIYESLGKFNSETMGLINDFWSYHVTQMEKEEYSTPIKLINLWKEYLSQLYPKDGDENILLDINEKEIMNYYTKFIEDQKKESPSLPSNPWDITK